MNWADFFHMGGYAMFVWPAYALALLVLIVNVVAPIRQHQQLRRELSQHRRAQRTASSGHSLSSRKP